MAFRLADAAVVVTVDSSELDSGLRQAERRTEGFAGTMQSILQGVFQGVGQRIFDVVANGAQRVISELGGAVRASSDLAESITKTNTVFAESADEVLDWSKTSSTAFGQSRQQALEAAGGFGNMFTAMGMARAESARMSMELVELASDIASINNLDPAEALEKLRAGLVGEAEPLRTVGVLLSETAVQTKALEMGLAASTKELTEQDKVLARYQIILDQTAIAHGDFERNARQAANAERILAAQWADSAATLGNTFRPAYEAILNVLIELVPQMRYYAENIMESFANGLAAAIRYITPVLITLKQLFAYWLQPGSPPRLLPDLTKWGAGTLQAWLDGFKPQAVRAALSGVGRAVESVLRSYVSTGQLTEGDLVSRVLGTRESISRAVREFQQMGRVSSETLAAIMRNAGPAGTSVAGLVRAYFDLQRASQQTARAQEELNRVTEYYDRLINPLRAALDDNRSQQQALRDEQRMADLRNDIADAALASARAEKAVQEIEAIRLRQRLATNQTWFEQVADAERIQELEREIADASAKHGAAQLARLEIEEIKLRQQLSQQEDVRDAAISAAQEQLRLAEEAEQAASDALQNEQAMIDIQLERNRLLAEEIKLREQIEQERIDAIKRADEEARQELERQQRDADAVASARFDYEFSVADTPQQLEMLQKRLAETEDGTVDYYRTLQQLSQLQQRYARELEQGSHDPAADAAKRAADAEFQYQLAIADTAGKLDLLNQKLAATETGSAEYYQLLTQIYGLQERYAQELERANSVTDEAAEAAQRVAEAQWQYQYTIADTAGKLDLLNQKLANTEEGSAEYYNLLGRLHQLQQQYNAELERTPHDPAAEAARRAADAEFQYQLAIADTPGKLDLLRQKLAETETGSAEYYQTLTQITQMERQYQQMLDSTARQEAAQAEREAAQAQREHEQAIREAEAELQRIQEAQFRYQLAITDTAGQIELYKQRLNELEPGSAEYYNTLTTIHNLEKRHNEELQKTASNLNTVGGINLSEALSAGVLEPIQETTEGAMNLRTAIEELHAELAKDPPEELPKFVERLTKILDSFALVKDTFIQQLDEIKRWFNENMPSVSVDVSTALSAMEGFWRAHGDIVVFIVSELLRLAGEIFKWGLDTLKSLFDAFAALFSGDWLGFLENLLSVLRTQWEFIFEAFRTLIGLVVGIIGEFNGDMERSAKEFVDSFWDGLRDRWDRVVDWTREKLRQLRNLFPFSEPKDPTSPLRGLAKSGRAIVETLQVGIDQASLGIDPLAERLLPPVSALPSAAANNSTTNTAFHIEVNIAGNANEDDVRKGVNLGIADAIRQHGWVI